MSNRTYAAGALIIAVVLFLAVNILANTWLTGARLDLTEHRLYTLSEGTLKTLERLDEPVHLRLYLSQKLATKLPRVSGYATRVRELLQEYALKAKGKLQVSIIDPEPFTEREDRAVSYGLQGIPLNDGESTFYFGLVGTNALDDVETIRYLSTEREQFLEYDITKLIYTLENPKRKVIGLLSTLPLDGMDRRAMMMRRQPQPWVILEQMRQLFEVKRIPTTAEDIPDDVNVLMIVHPKKLSERTLYAIDQFVLRGGRVLAFIDPNAEADQTQGIAGLPPLPQASNLHRLLKSWGVKIVSGKSVGDLQLAVKVRSRQGGRTVTSQYPPWINVPSQLLNSQDIVTGNLGNLTFGSAGAIEPLADATTRMAPLATSSEGAMLVKNELIGPMADLDSLKRSFKPAGKRFTLAARIQGPARSAFEATPPRKEKSKNKGGEKAKKTAKEKPRLERSKQDINVIVVADTDFLQDQFWVQVQNFLSQRIVVPIAANGNFVINALENLSGSAELISVRSRGRFLRPFLRVNQLREAAEINFRAKEKQLLDRLDKTEKRLKALQKSKGDGLILSDAQRREIESFRREKVRIRKDLRDVRHALRKDIETLEATLKFVNIGLVPILIALGGTLLGAYRVRRRRRATHSRVA